MPAAASTPMKVQSQSPRLRFSGFEESWELKPIKRLLHLTDRPFKMADDGVYSLIKVRRGNNGVVSRGNFEGRKVLVKSQFMVQTDDFVISKRQIVHQACGIVPKELDGAIVSNEYDVFKPTEECCVRYFDFLTYRPQMRHAFFLSSVGVHLEKMLFKTNDWLKRRFYFPSAPEQRKIADFLTAVDGRIAQLRQKKTLLGAYKKGVMQQLFTQALRFQDEHGNDFPDWEESALGAIADIKLGKMLDKEKHTTGRLLPYLNNISLRWNDVNTSNLPKMYFHENELERFGLGAGDVVVCEGGEPGRSAVWDGRLPDLKFQKAIHRVRFKIPFEPRLLVLYLEHIAGTTQFEMLFTGGGIKHLTRETFAQLQIPMISLPEQTKIANFLTVLDRKIDAVAAQIAHTQTWKKGLLQQMFV